MLGRTRWVGWNFIKIPQPTAAACSRSSLQQRKITVWVRARVRVKLQDPSSGWKENSTACSGKVGYCILL